MFDGNGLFRINFAKPIQLSGPVDEFVDCRIANVHPDLDEAQRALEDNKAQDGRKGRVEITVTQIDCAEVRTAKTEFLKAVDDLDRKSRKELGPGSIVDLAPNDSYSWDHVLDTLKDADARYQNVKDSGAPAQRIRHMLRKCEGLSGPVNSWLRLLPSESWQASLICGGLKIVIGVAVKLDQVREDIRTVIEQIPVCIQSASKLSEIYPQAVEAHATRVIVCTLGVMQRCLQHFTISPFKKVGKAIVQGERYGKSLKEAIDEMKRVREDMDRVATLMLHQSQHDTSESIHQQLQITNQKLDQSSIRDEKAGATLNEMRQMLEAQQKDLNAEKILRSEVYDLRRALLLQRKDNLLGYLQFDPEPCQNDLLQCCRIAPAMPDDARERANYIISSPQIREWMESGETASIVVNGHEATGMVSHCGVSLFSSTLVSVLQRQMADGVNQVALFWFCGQNIHGTVQMMVDSLLGQLLCSGLQQADWQETLLGGNRLPRGTDERIILLTKLLRAQLRESEVHLVIDSVSRYEDSRRVRELLSLWQSLGNLATLGNEAKHPLKVVVTSPVQCTNIGTSFDPTRPSVLWVPEVLA